MDPTIVRDPMYQQINKRLRLLVLGGLISVAEIGAAETPPARLDEKQREFFKSYCVECHNAEKQEGKLRLDDIAFVIGSIELADRWQKILNQLNAGEMPPENAKQPERGAKTEFLDALSRTLVTARQSLGDVRGKITMRRLNRREYKNTIRDLLGVDLRVNELPADGGAGTFDTVGSSLFMSSDQFEQYLALGRQALDEHFARYVVPALAPPRRMRLEGEETSARIARTMADRAKIYERYLKWTAAVDAVAQRPENAALAAKLRSEKPASPSDFYLAWQKLPGAPSPADYDFQDAAQADVQGRYVWTNLGPYFRYYLEQPGAKSGAYLTIGDTSFNPSHSFQLPRDWPAGDYVVRVRMAATENTPATRHFVEFGSLHDPLSRGVASKILSTHQITGTPDKPQLLEIPLKFFPAEGRGFFLREKGTQDSEEVGQRLVAEAKKRNGIGPEVALWIDWIEYEGPLNSNSQRAVEPVLFASTTGLSERDHARAILERFATRAFRDQTPKPEYLDKLVKLFETRQQAGDKFDIAIREPLSVVLASPRFLYLQETGGLADAKKAATNVSPSPNPSVALSPTELASRLSYFLWSAPPDETLLALARSGDLQKPDVLAAQVDRMLSQEKSREFVHGFVPQWLSIERLDFFQFNTQLYRDFDESMKAAARREVYETVAFLLRENGSARDLLKSDYVVVNGLLANFYGLDGVSGDEFRKVPLPADSPRGGLLGMSAIMAMGSNGEVSSPVERGAWVLRKLLHDPPPPAPPNVPQLTRLEGKLLTTRERILAHQEQPQCASCHRKIDPIGFGLENFNAVGKWRTEDRYEKKGVGKKEWPIDPSGSLHKGPSFKTYFELRDIIASKPDQFSRGLTEALIEYALGRPYGFTDEALATTVVQRASEKNFALREFIHGIVQSNSFQTK